MKVRIKREQIDRFLELKKGFIGTLGGEIIHKELDNILPNEFELEIDESQVVKEKSNREKWDIFLDKFAVNKDSGSMEYEARMARNHFSEIARRMEIATLLDSLGYDATKAYERIMEGK